MELFLTEHNKRVEKKKQFHIGNVTVKDNNDYISYSSSEYSVTLDAIQEKLMKTHGGYLQVRYTREGKMLDYLEDFTAFSLQKVEYGKNLLDVKITQDHTERITVLIPLGAKIKETDEDGNEVETGKRVTITGVNEGVEYVYDEKALKEIGWIWTVEVWDDVTEPGNLLRKAKSWVAELAKGITSMELSIVDESDAGVDIMDIHARQYVDCLSPPHGIDGRYLCVSKTRDYLNPSGNTITIGASSITLTSLSAKQHGNLNTLEKDIMDQDSKLEDMSGKVEEIQSSKMYRTELLVEGVNIFKDRGQKSTIRCRVYSWDKEITDTLDASAFCWHRNSGNEETDADWDRLHAGRKSIVITTEDVQDNASFYCEIKI